MFRLAVTASPWDQSDLWPLRNGQGWKQKQRPFVWVKGKTSAGLKTQREEGGLTLRDSSFGLFSHLWWEVPDGNMQKATVRHIITTRILLILLINPPAASLLSRKNWLEKKADKYNMGESLIWMLQQLLSHHHRSHWSQLVFHFLN